MNIIVKPYDCNFCYCRPDTTWEKENRDFYIPEGIDNLSWAPVAFARISKAGKCIGRKFVSRYYDSFNFGALLYCVHDEHSRGNELAFSSCVDHSSLLPSPLYNTVVMESEDNEYEVRCKGQELFRAKAADIRQDLENAIVTASRLTSLRIGDYVAVELDNIRTLACREEAESSIQASFCENPLFDLKLIF